MESTRVRVNAATGEVVTETYTIPDPTPEEVEAARLANLENVLRQYKQALEVKYQEVASSKDYTSRATFVARAGYTNPWMEEATAYANWVDACILYGYQIKDAVLAGGDIPPLNDFMAGLPEIVWPA